MAVRVGLAARLLLILPVLLVGCATKHAALYTGGEVFRDEFEIGAHRVPLPEGEWRFVAYNLYQNRDGHPFADVQLVQVDDEQHQLVRGVMISANLAAGVPIEAPKAAFCDSESVYHKSVIRNVRGDDQDCWIVSYFRSAVGRGTDKVSTQMLAYLHANRIRYPHFAVFAAYRLVSETDSLTVQYYFNPEYQTRIAAAQRVSWQDSPWHMDSYHHDPMKVEYIERMKAWSGDWYERVKMGFALQ